MHTGSSWIMCEDGFIWVCHGKTGHWIFIFFEVVEEIGQLGLFHLNKLVCLGWVEYLFEDIYIDVAPVEDSCNDLDGW